MSARAIILASALAGASAAFTRFIADDATTQKFGAFALDGTPGAVFYYQQGSGSSSNDWAIYHEGGGWCYSPADCYGRSKGSLGSSKFAPTTVSLGGLLSNDCTASPLCNYNVVYMKYLDGNSFSGLRTDPLIFNNGTADVPLYFRGRANLDAIFDMVKRNVMNSPNLIANARHIVETGCSAGGLATYLHADYIATQFPHSGQYMSAPISGYFINDVSVGTGTTVYGDQIAVIHEMSNASTNDACTAFYTPTKDTWRCNMAEYVYPFIQANVFVLNSQYDSWQSGCIMTAEPVTPGASNNGNCSAAPGWNACARSIPACSASQISGTFNPFGAYMVDSLTKTNAAKSGAAGQGGFVHSCHTHCEAQGSSFDTFSIAGTTMAAAFTAWYNSNIATGGASPAGANWHFDCALDPTTPKHVCNPSCPVSTPPALTWV